MTEYNILIVEFDSIALETIAEQILRPHGFNPLATRNSPEGIKLAQTESPDLLLLHLPINDVRQFLVSVRESGCTAPAILIVEQRDSQVDVDLLRLGIRDLVPWPPLPENLLAAIYHILGRKNGTVHTTKYNYPYLEFEFADMASHLMRNPLSVIQTSIRCLQNLELSPSEQNALLEKIWSQSQRLTDFTNELLKILRIEVENTYIYRTPIAVWPIMQQVVGMVQNEKPDIKFNILEPEQPLPPAAADSTKTELILLNLLMSAIRRCPAGSEITLAVELVGKQIVMCVSDNGKPIPITETQKIFQPFYPVGQSRQGVPSTYQLGMHTTKRLVELQQGQIWAESKAGEGSRFCFSLPIWEIEQ